MKASIKTGSELQDHIFDTYISLRYGIAFLALAFPFVVPLAGWFHGDSLRGSLSEYFCEGGGTGDMSGVFAARTGFVGILFAVGSALYLYKGFSSLENYLLNVAGIGALLVALIPTPCRDAGYTLTILGLTLHGLTAHGIAATALFICVALVCLLCSGGTLHLVPSPTARAWYERAYKVLAILMVVLPLFAVLLSVASGPGGKPILAVEAAGTLVFGAYWLLKSIELSHSGALRKAAQGAV